jgi:hypothetical protein
MPAPEVKFLAGAVIHSNGFAAAVDELILPHACNGSGSV